MSTYHVFPFLFRNEIVDDSQNDLKIIQTGTNEYIFTRLKKTEDADDKDFTDESGSGFYVMYKTPEMKEWVYSPQKVNFDSLDYSNDLTSDHQSKIEHYFQTLSFNLSFR